jgi:hypothetical protein
MPYRILKGLKIILFILIAATVLGFVTMELWNALLPQIFGWNRITFWQSLGLIVLSRILFGGFHRHSGHRDQWKRRMKRRWEKMTPEERERFRKGMSCRRNPFTRGEEQPAEPRI